MKLLAEQSSNAKLRKNAKYSDKIRSYIMYMKPDRSVCPMSELAGCEVACLNTAGRGAMNSVQAARQRKLDYWLNSPDDFLAQLRAELTKINVTCYKKGKSPAVRLNGTSDIAWENTGIITDFPDIQFYDYTKLPNRKVPDNYHLTVSYSGANAKYAQKVKDSRHNIAVVFRKELPISYLDREVISGDDHDMRFYDKRGVVVGLTAKGAAKKDQSGFVIDI